MMGADYNSMMGSYGGTMMLFGWLAYILIVVLIFLSIAALWKYLNK
ncbi:MAG: Uncharacterized protein Athens101428_520 [Candidatus Berkelbacteria bacterium Athens1014_28]|uniref:Uncharacterized protein n=1 Tax=Candidatus Berkelbacteria bacterium Athens1014_28 TaxID=2017145 RepID=A0A554LLR9_9BACT|nr:MAG: Uncharacterized protein Athens101428_520 [Candidatus Berkelbacteria bacterium Athens1014_28]